MKEYPRKLRISTQLQRELSELIVDTLTDPRIRGVSISQVDVSPDLRNATVLVSSLGSEAELAGAVKALAGAVPLLHILLPVGSALIQLALWLTLATGLVNYARWLAVRGSGLGERVLVASTRQGRLREIDPSAGRLRSAWL